MTQTLIALLSILFGIFGGNSTSIIAKKYSFGILGNTIAGVFGSVFLIKTFGRLGFNPTLIMHNGVVNYYMFAINLIVSFLGGLFAVMVLQKLKKMFDKE